MPKIITTITKQSSEPWIILKEGMSSDIFSEEERNNIILPYIEYVRSLPGIISDETLSTVENNTFTSILSFDTIEHTTAAYNKLFGAQLDAIVVAKNDLLKQKMTSSNLRYNVQKNIEQ